MAHCDRNSYLFYSIRDIKELFLIFVKLDDFKRSATVVVKWWNRIQIYNIIIGRNIFMPQYLKVLNQSDTYSGAFTYCTISTACK